MVLPLCIRSRAGVFPLVAVVCALACWADRPLTAQGAGALTIPIRVVNGHVVVLTDLVGLRYTNEASFEISLQYPDALTLHPDQYGWLGFDPNDVSIADPPMIHLRISPGIDLAIPAKDVAVEQSSERLAFQNMMTKLYSSDLGERKLKGTIGIGLLKKYHVTLDVAAKQLVLTPPRAPDDPVPARDVADVVEPFEYVNDTIQVGVTYGDNRRGRMVIGGADYDTFIDARVATPLGRPAGDVAPAWLTDTATADKKLDLSRYLAFRPKAFGLAPVPSAESPVLVAGVNFLELFRVDLDWAGQTLALTRKTPPQYPQQDFEFFKAESAGTADAVQAYLEKYPRERLSAEAAGLLVTRRFEKDHASDAEVLNAMRWAIDTTPPPRRIEICQSYSALFAEAPGRVDLAIAAGLEGLKYSREAFDARVVYQLHNQLGELYLKKDALTDAWKHFLSAAFMAPDDPAIALNLARVYDKQGQVRRAYARYKKVAAVPDAPPEVAAEVKSAMDRLRKLLPKDDPLLRDEKTGRGGGGGR